MKETHPFPLVLSQFDLGDFERKRKIILEKGLDLKKERRRLEQLMRNNVEFTLLVDEIRKTLNIKL